MNTIGERIAAERHTKRWTQVRLASELGITQSQLSEIETNSYSPKWELIERIAEKLNVPVHKILPATTFIIWNNEFKEHSLGNYNTYSQNQDGLALLSDLIKSIAAMTDAIKDLLVKK
jgi:transcriptional regulator with XRE-family HTH domain